MLEKQCRACELEKPLSDFYVNRTAKDGYELDCKSCKLDKEWKSDEIKNIYLLLDHDRKAVKVGITREPVEKRLNVIQGQNIGQLSILATVPGTHTDERRLHKRFAAHHIYREWFRAHRDILAAFGLDFRYTFCYTMSMAKLVKLFLIVLCSLALPAAASAMDVTNVSVVRQDLAIAAQYWEATLSPYVVEVAPLKTVAPGVVAEAYTPGHSQRIAPESRHHSADHALLEFVGNKVTPKLAQLIEEAYNDIEKWYG